MRRDLASKKLAVPAEVDEPFTRRSVLMKQREVRRALPDGFDDPQNASQYRELRTLFGDASGIGNAEVGRNGDIAEQHRKQALQAFAARLIEPADERRRAQLQKQSRRFRRLLEAGARQRLRQDGSLHL